MREREHGGSSTVNRNHGTANHLVQAGRIDQVILQSSDSASTAEAVVVPVMGTEMAAPELFVGRDEQVEALLGALAPDDGRSRTAVVSAVAGMGGVGKTALVRHAADLAVDRGWFAGGAVVVDLHGYDLDRQGVRPEQVFAPLLRALGMQGASVPATAAEQATAYHQLLAAAAAQGQRMLVVLDNASTGDQVRDLLPQQRAHRALVTTRDTLALPASTRRLVLDVLGIDDAVVLLDRAVHEQRPDDDRIHADRPAAKALAQVCGGLPLALRIVAALLADDADLPIGRLAAELRQAPVGGFAHGETAVGSAFAVSWQRLRSRAPEAARLLTLLLLNTGPEFAIEIAAALAGQPEPLVRTQLRTLCQAHLLQHGNGRWRMHDLIRSYTMEHTVAELRTEQTAAAAMPATENMAAALIALFEYYTDGVKAANKHLRAFENRFTGPPADAVTALLDQFVREAQKDEEHVRRMRELRALQGPDLFADLDEALDWLDAELLNLVGTVHVAAGGGFHSDAFTLATALDRYLAMENHLAVRLITARVACAAAEHLDHDRLAIACNKLGGALVAADRLEEAIAVHQREVALYQELGDLDGEGRAWGALGTTLAAADRFEEAIASHRQELAIAQELDDLDAQGKAWANLGDSLTEMAEFDEAFSAYYEAISAFKNGENRWYEAITWNHLGLAYAWLVMDEAIVAQEMALDLFREIGDRDGEGAALVAMGMVEELLKPEKACEYWREAQSVFRDIGDNDAVERVQYLIDNVKEP
ncbi:tetratricopeptide repeat protein [Lentzea indica]|uniref:tetratricopeptide repeat protein n=1 Tax=Lentzea indica TaxID=2604800 RepID=UPI00143B9E18|nr:tetratricopeptide repeat protein [Lentzea indica]